MSANAHLFINYIMDPQVIAENLQFRRESNVQFSRIAGAR